jgi:dTDP-glucose 4,6-dehydratase
MPRTSLLVTGGAGFIGSNFIPFYFAKYPDHTVVNLDLLTYAGDTGNLSELSGNDRHIFVKGDIGDRALLQELFEAHRFSGVIHFAAESHVDNSILGPEAFIRTNVLGTFTLLDVARHAWMTAPFEFRDGCAGNRLHHISTDEVYGSLGPTGAFSESTAYAPNSPYSASKAASDHLVRSYHHTFGMNVVTTNCSNNYGPRQHGEKLIPTIIRSALQGKAIPIYGDGKNVRDWLYVLDHCKAIERVYTSAEAGETYNIGGGHEVTNNEIVDAICTLLDQLAPRSDRASYRKQITFVRDRAGHDRRYAIDASKIKRDLGWTPEETFETGIKKTVDWYLSRYPITL